MNGRVAIKPAPIHPDVVKNGKYISQMATNKSAVHQKEIDALKAKHEFELAKLKEKHSSAGKTKKAAK